MTGAQSNFDLVVFMVWKWDCLRPRPRAGFRSLPGTHQAVEGTQRAPHLEQQDPPLRTWWRPLLVAGHSPFTSHKVAAVRAATVTVVAAVVVVVVLMVVWLVGWRLGGLVD